MLDPRYLRLMGLAAQDRAQRDAADKSKDERDADAPAKREEEPVA